ncbi:oxygen-independent coproporphyrinogen III oxidase [Flavobacterium columnare]|uniref:Coproporphyrinogen-III oxidase n=1 Tax=Flavobacterium columnare (strain ATCC 49512 / CIP 103533 / TG 44/87) TaxID=1041826 RepID=G8X933_FLACA|nr:oxygen-independent coproporphyrinogen III oxidase [Flavobacterium columnare]AEW85084.1 coproporphyrinogen III oxidase [Flavobacterium columnare ATCC 49512]MBF6654562.1 oxygen-independent coproporphyrinogen III oxidase [Flavobacterium columnare]MBF6658002.1 oxygen-independent coproporphyrinogen III oxidase [Flavobacterium columnare]MEB3800215.1 oxygen-independent coproporphyrinogen III oxidase [Flavobacterium columnare]OOB84156.1 oxygen-independent coproporphyrinogen III oxidase [Flavobacter
MSTSLIQKYNVPGPRYTSYPTVPYWENQEFTVKEWTKTVLKSFHESNKKEGISLYIHLPFCESLCTFCGCHKRITKRHEVEKPYIDAVLKEWNLYCALFHEPPIIKEIHLGGGTPTFFSNENLTLLINGILSKAQIAPDHEFSFEGHPNNTTRTHLQTLYDLGFRRVSFGVQDYSEKVQKAINRIQPFQNVAKVTLWAREIGYTSISHDLVFGLPFQGIENIVDTIEKTKSLLPERLAFYSYAHVPWIKGNGQRGFNDQDVPKDEEKRKLYEIGKQLLYKKGYHEIGMDHFARKKDSLYIASQEGKLHRNFMGYTASKTQLMIGLGVSSISDSWYSFAQNEKTVEDYYTALANNILPISKGHILSKEDLVIRKHILNLMCQFTTSWDTNHLYLEDMPQILTQLKEMELDGLVILQPNAITVTEKGKPFVRNICMAFDLRLKRKTPQTQLFSMTI